MLGGPSKIISDTSTAIDYLKLEYWIGVEMGGGVDS